MPSVLHQALIELFRVRPTLAAELLRDALRAPVPTFTDVRFESAVLDDAAPSEYRADLVVVLAAGPPVLAIIVEVQLRRKDQKRFAWSVYVAGVRARFGCPAVLLVVAPSAPMAKWCSAPIELGHPGCVLRPLVLGPDGLPVVTNAKQATLSPELALLSVVAHGRGKHGLAVAVAVLAAAAGLDEERGRSYADLALTCVRGATRAALEEMMESGKYQYRSKFARKYVAQGQAEGKAQGILAVLDTRSIDVSPEVRARILECTDVAVLDVWLRRAVTVRTAAELFDAS